MSYGEYHPNINGATASSAQIAEVVDPIISKLFEHTKEEPNVSCCDPDELSFTTTTTYNFPLNGGACTLSHTTPLKVWGASEWGFRPLDEGVVRANIVYPPSDELPTSWELRTALDMTMMHDAIDDAYHQTDCLEATAEHGIAFHYDIDPSEHHDRVVKVSREQVRHSGDGSNDDCWQSGMETFLFKDRASLKGPDQPVFKAWRRSSSDLWQASYRTHPYEGRLGRLTGRRLEAFELALEGVGIALARNREQARAVQQPSQ